MSRARRRHSAQTKLKAVLELLKGERSVAQIARGYRVHPNSIAGWKQTLLDRGTEIFETRSTGSESKKRIAELERLLGKKELEIALLKNFLGRSV
jgi:transposase-like protein